MLNERKQRKKRVYPAAPSRIRRFIARLSERLYVVRVAVKVGLSLAVAAHLGMVIVLPGGWNGLMQFDARATLPHLTHFPVSDAFGFADGQFGKGFILYRIFTQEGTTLEGVFPDSNILPYLRFDRWAAAGDVMSRDQPELHAILLDYILAHLPSAPVKLEMYAGQWVDGRSVSTGVAEGDGSERRYRLTKLGSHDGLTRLWRPSGPKMTE
ncbi:MAG: hypothetical protein IID61_01340 [SAR324 cluster bacterium]|nr:hypothetical protein [SAR324 cluster bacterium]